MNHKLLVDCHTHKYRENTRIIVSVDLRKIKEIPNTLFCAGAHPWWSTDLDINEIKIKLDKLINHKYFCALGELGLDKAKNNWTEQVELFKWQLDYAQENNIQNLILHCVRAHNEVLSIIKAYKVNFNLLWHDFNANEQVVLQLLKHDSYFSIGPSLLKNNSKINASIQSIPIERLLFESDCLEHLDLMKIYQKASRLLKIQLQDLISIANKNLDRFILKGDVL